MTSAIHGAPPAVLEPLRLPLHGRRLIEAGAGTGKTFTIAALYVRLVLGHGGAAAYPRALSPREILVVTFTEAATQELRDRIRARLAAAADCFRADPDRIVADQRLRELRDDYPPAHWPACARTLQLAAESMDEAAISTIHGWCHRMLREHAFDSDSLFTQRLETDQRELLAEAVRDYWRTFMAPLDAEAVAEARRWWAGPAALAPQMLELVAHVGLLADAPPPDDSLARARRERMRRLAAIKAPWAAWADELQALLDAAVARKQVNGHKLQARYYLPWLDSLRRWRDDPTLTAPDLKTGWTRLTPGGLAEAWKVGAPPPHPALDALAGLATTLAALPDAREDLLRHAARWVARRFAAEQARRAQMGFDDLLNRLDAALSVTADGNGQRLAGRIRQQFPVALIDEFQDTDPVQYRIFDAVYGLAGRATDGGTAAGNGAATGFSTGFPTDAATTYALILIGDPKQAIYAFRGADIRTYLTARKACAGRVHTLRRNFRSTPAMVAAVNHCFAVAEARPAGDGAFLFRQGADNPLPFVTAEAQGRREAWRPDLAPESGSVAGSESVPAPALTVWWLPPHPDGKPLSKDDYRRQMATACAGELVRLLRRGQQGRAGFVDAAEPGLESLRSIRAVRPVRPADMAVLVNGRAEADAMRAALAQGGVRSVYLSDRESVFQSAEAAEVQHWLAACAEPGDARLLRAALATATLALPWAALERLNRDESAWEARVLQFRGYRDCWRRQGVLPMLRRLLNDFAVPARLLGASGTGAGERALTNILHLAELLQQASRLLDGEHALLRHLAGQRRETAAGSGDARQLRLESDADLVQVVTIHKAKGLEYPLVFLPFAGNYRPVDARDARPLRWHDAQGQPRIALSPDAGVLERADRERLGEDLRKLYVALTRARHATWLGLAPLEALEKSAFGHLLGGGAAIAPADLPATLRAWAAPCPAIAVAQAPAADAGRYLPAVAATARGAARQSARVAREHWWIASYSALDSVGSAGGDTGLDRLPVEAPESATADVFRETLAATDHDAVQPPAPASLHDFPRGAEAGTFLHEVLEWAAGQGFANAAADAPALREILSRRCEARGWQRWLAPLAAWLPRFLRLPLPLPCAGEGGDGGDDCNTGGDALPTVAFADLSATKAEMEFWLAAHAVDTARIDALVRRYTLDGAARPALRDGQLNGMLKGFIDLVFEHRGRYYVADYKSNWLGPDDAAYTPAAMRAAILHARYELQYVLYLLALHRLLKSRLADYDYDRHVGGAVYLFLRGSDAASRGVHGERPPRALIAALDALFAGAGEAR